MSSGITPKMAQYAHSLARNLDAAGLTVDARPVADGQAGIHVAPIGCPAAGVHLRYEQTAAGEHLVSPAGMHLATLDAAAGYVLFLYGRG